MKLSHLIKECKKLYPDIPDPEIRIVAHGGFHNVRFINRRQDYEDLNFFADIEYETGCFICLEYMT